MVFILNESKAKRIFETYKNVAAFTLGKHSKFQENGLEISYEKLNFLPDADTVNGVVSGDISGKKIVKEAVKALHSPKPENQSICLSMVQLIGILDNKSKKADPNILVFILDDPDDSDATKIRNKFLTKYLTGLFGEFGIRVLSGKDAKKPLKMFKVDLKVPKKLLKQAELDETRNKDRKKKKKAIKKIKKLQKAARQQVVSDVVHFIAKSAKSKKGGMRLSNAGYALKKRLQTFYSIELRQTGLSHISIDDLGRRDIEVLVKSLVNAYTNDNMKNVGSFTKGDKEANKVCKQLAKKNKAAVEAYESLSDVLGAMNPDIDLPKAKHGYQKKHKKNPNKGKPKMKVKKFVEFYTKRRNRPILAMIYAHTTALALGCEIGSSNYNKFMKPMVESVTDATTAKSFIDAAKAYAKAAASGSAA